MPKISIIVPIYNTEKYLRDCINSVLSQQYEDYELLLINDGSTDSSERICHDYALRDSRVKVFNKSNGGQPEALNYGIERAMGDYLMFLDADDYWCDNNILSKLYQAAETYNLDLVRGECKEVNDRGEELFSYLEEKRTRSFAYQLMDSDLFIDKVVDRRYFMVLYLIRRASLGGLRYNVNRVFLQDAEFNLTLCSKDLKCMYVPEVFYSYRKHEGAITVKPHPQKLYDAFDFSRFCFELFDKVGSTKMRTFCVKEGINNLLFDLSVIAIECPWSDITKSYTKYDLYTLREEACRLLHKTSLKGKYQLCYMPLPFIILYYKLKNQLYKLANCRNLSKIDRC